MNVKSVLTSVLEMESTFWKSRVIGKFTSNNNKPSKGRFQTDAERVVSGTNSIPRVHAHRQDFTLTLLIFFNYVLIQCRGVSVNTTVTLVRTNCVEDTSGLSLKGS